MTLDFAVPVAAQEAGAQARDMFSMHGCFVVREFFDAARIAELSRQADPILEQWFSENGAAYRECGAANMHSLTDPRYFICDPSLRLRFFSLLLPRPLTALLDAVFGDGLYFHNTQLFFDPHNPDRQPYWHRDLQFSPAGDDAQAAEQGRLLSLHVRIPLHAEKGLAIVPGSHRRWDTERERDVRFGRAGHRSNEVLSGAVLVELEPGDVAVFDAQMLHRGHYRSEGRAGPQRKALDLCIGKPHPLTSPWLDPKVLPDDDELAQIAHGHWYRRAREVAAAHRQD